MRKIIISLHVSLDGFAGGPNGEMDWIKFDEEMFDFVGNLTADCDTALYGRKTYEMMDAYWPTAADQPDASKHDKEHSEWYNKVEKVIISRTLNDEKPKTTFISDDVPKQIRQLKTQGNKNIILFGSPTTVHTLIENNLIDEFWLFVNPVILGNGIPLYPMLKHPVNLKPGLTKVFPCGVTGLNYTII